MTGMSPRAERLIREALAEERPPPAAQRTRVKGAVLAAVLAQTTAAAAGATGLGALPTAAGKLGTTTWLGVWGAKATGVALLVLGATAAVSSLPRSVFRVSPETPGAIHEGSPSVPPRHLAVKGPPGLPTAGAEQRDVSTRPPGVSAPAGSPARTAPPGRTAAPGRIVAPHASPSARRGGMPGPPVPAGAPSARTLAGPTAAFELLPSGIPALPSSAELEQELADLERVQAHLRSGRGEAALAVLDARASRATLLTEESLASEVLAACQAGQMERARSAARTFFQRAHGSLLAERVRRSCAFAPAQSDETRNSRH